MNDITQSRAEWHSSLLQIYKMDHYLSLTDR